LILLLVLIL